MLKELKSPESYFQAAFRVQSPWRNAFINTEVGGEEEVVLKEQCYVLDFSPNRALRQIVDYATRLRAEVGSERDDEAAIEEFMEFLPVLSFDGYSMSQLRASDVIDYLTKGVSSSMLARRWNSPELLTLDVRAMEALLADPTLLESLEQIEMFRNITNDLTMMISTNKELRDKKLTKEKLTKEETSRKDDAAKRRESLKKKLQRLITRIPAFMYLTDDREKTIRDIIQQLEPELFEKVTGLTLSDFGKLVDARVFNDVKMNDAVWKFRSFEEPSLGYGPSTNRIETLGGWTLRRNEDFAQLLVLGLLQAGETVWASNGFEDVSALITEDYAFLVKGLRVEDPDEAIRLASDGFSSDGWKGWFIRRESGQTTLEELRQSL